MIDNFAKALFNGDRKKNKWDEEHEKSNAEREKLEQAYKALACEYNEKAFTMLNDYDSNKQWFS